MTGDQEKPVKDIVQCGSHSKLTVLFATNLFNLGQVQDSAKVIEEVGLEYQTDSLTLANIYKLQALVFYHDLYFTSSITTLNNALKQYKESKSILGLAICYLL